MIKNKLKECPCCGGHTFNQQSVLWPALVKEWGLSEVEHKYIDKQQGYFCTNCSSSLRSMNLAGAILKSYNFTGTLADFVKKYNKKIDILEVNEAGNLNQFLKKMARHTLASYPKVIFEKLPYDDSSFDLVVHSDTLEHVSNPIKALEETFRVLRPKGITCFTVPIVVGRLTKQRKGKIKSYHGSPGNDEYLVVTEYGSDAWIQVMEAGFSECSLLSFDYPASIAIVAIK